jgi:hypothetical protein
MQSDTLAAKATLLAAKATVFGALALTLSNVSTPLTAC